MSIPEHKVLRLSLCVIMAAAFQSDATVTLTTPSNPPCFGQTYKLTCTHPVLDDDTIVRWERNGAGFNPRSTPNHDGDGSTPTTTPLIITVTREEFENKVNTYRCFTFDLNVGLSDPNRVISNEVPVDPPEVPNAPRNLTCLIFRTGYINCNWTYDSECFTNVSYEYVLKGYGGLTMFNETTPETSFINQVKIENNADGKLDDNNVNTKFNICVIAVYGSKRSDPAVVTNISIKPKGTDTNKSPLDTKPATFPGSLIGGIVAAILILIVVIVFGAIVLVLFYKKMNTASNRDLKMSGPDPNVPPELYKETIIENPSTAGITYATLDFCKPEESESGKTIEGRATKSTSEKCQTIIYAEPCRCCSKGCTIKEKFKLCEGCDSSKPRSRVFSCGHQFCSKCSDKLEICPQCLTKPNGSVALTFEPLPEKEKKHFCKKCIKSCTSQYCQSCFNPERPVVAVYYCGHLVCETCKKNSHCGDKIFVEFKSGPTEK